MSNQLERICIDELLFELELLFKEYNNKIRSF